MGLSKSILHIQFYWGIDAIVMCWQDNDACEVLQQTCIDTMRVHRCGPCVINSNYKAIWISLQQTFGLMHVEIQYRYYSSNRMHDSIICATISVMSTRKLTMNRNAFYTCKEICFMTLIVSLPSSCSSAL